MSQYRFVTNGSYVDFFIDGQFVTGIPTNFTGFTWYYNNNPGINFSFLGNSIFTDNVEDIIFNDVPLASKEDFKTQLGILFPHFSSSGSVPNFDQVLAVGGIINPGRSINLNGQVLAFIGGLIDAQLQMAEFADNAAAISGGVANGKHYFTTVDGERIVKQAHD